MPKKWTSRLIVLAVLGVTGCRSQYVLQQAAQEKAFRQRYIGPTFYTAMVLRPYEFGDAYLVDLTGRIAEAPVETPRAALKIPLGTPLILTALTEDHLTARVTGHTRVFRILVRTKLGGLAALSEELAQLVSETPPLASVRLAMRPVIVREEITTGMSRREVYMSWGQPDRVIGSPGASGFLEEWIYFDRQSHVFLHNGFITNWQQY